MEGEDYSVIGEYKNTNTKIKIRHNRCNYVYCVTPDNFLMGRRCPQCAESKGEQSIRLYLENSNIKFQQEYRFEDLVGVGGQPLRFDFAVFEKKKNLKILIEYDGEHHFEAIEGLGGVNKFNTQQNHDSRKNNYCEENNIPLLRISYWDFDSIEEILEKTLKRYGI